MASNSKFIGNESFEYKYRALRPIAILGFPVLAIFIYGLFTYTEDIDFSYVVVFIATLAASIICFSRLFDSYIRLVFFSKAKKGILNKREEVKRLKNSNLIEVIRFMQSKNININQNIIDELRGRSLLNGNVDINDRGLFILGDAFDITLNLKAEFLLSDDFLYVDFWPIKSELVIQRKDIIGISYRKQKYMIGLVPRIGDIIRIEINDRGKTRVLKANAANYERWLSFISNNPVS